MGRHVTAVLAVITVVVITASTIAVSGTYVPIGVSHRAAQLSSPEHRNLAPSTLTPSVLAKDGADPTALGLDWSLSACAVFENYTIQYSTVGASGPWTTVAVYTARLTTASLTYGLTPSTPYWWQELDNCLTLRYTWAYGPETQPAVATLTYTIPSPSSISLTWNNNADYSGLVTFVSYHVMEAVNGGSYTSVATITSASTMVDNITGLASGTNYGFYIVTSDDCGTCSPTGSFTSDSNVVTYGSPIALTASATANPGTIDDGQPTTLSCAAAGGASPYTYSWSFGDGTPGASGQTVSHTYNTAGNMSPTCTVTDNSGTKASGATPVTVNKPITVTVTVSHAFVSPGTAITFSLTASGGSSSYTNYTWVFGDGTNGYGTSLTHTYTNSGTYNAIAYVKDTLSGTGTGSVKIYVAALTVAATESASYGLPGTTFYLNATGSGGSGSPYSYSWSFGDLTTGSGASTTHVYHSPGNYTPSVSVTDSLGATTSTTLATIDIEKPVAASIQLSDPVSTPGETVTLTGVGTGGSGGYTCSWIFGDSQTGSGCTTTYSWAGNQSYTVSLTLSDSQGHSASAAATEVVEPALVTTAQATSTSPTVGAQTTLTARPTGGSGTYSCLWNFGDHASGAGCTATHSWSAAGTYQAEVTVNDTSGRTSHAWLNVTVIAPLTATISLSATSAGVGQSVTITATITGGSGGNSCHWDFGDSNSGNGCTLAHAWVTSGKYMVTLTVNNSAGHHTTAYANVTITVSSSSGGSAGLSSHGSSTLVGVLLIVAAVMLAVAAMMLFIRYRPGKGSQGGTTKGSEWVSTKKDEPQTAQSSAPAQSISEEWKEP